MVLILLPGYEKLLLVLEKVQSCCHCWTAVHVKDKQGHRGQVNGQLRDQCLALSVHTLVSTWAGHLQHSIQVITESIGVYHHKADAATTRHTFILQGESKSLLAKNSPMRKPEIHTEESRLARNENSPLVARHRLNFVKCRHTKIFKETAK